MGRLALQGASLRLMAIYMSSLRMLRLIIHWALFFLASVIDFLGCNFLEIAKIQSSSYLLPKYYAIARESNSYISVIKES